MENNPSSSLKTKAKFQIPKVKAELPQFIVAGVLSIVISLFHLGFFGAIGFIISFCILFTLLFIIYSKYKAPYFVEVDTEGIRWKSHIFSKYINLPWNYLLRIDYLTNEINFMLKETNQVICFGTSQITELESEELKQVISNIIALKPIGIQN